MCEKCTPLEISEPHFPEGKKPILKEMNFQFAKKSSEIKLKIKTKKTK